MIEFIYEGVIYKYDNHVLHVENISYDCAWVLLNTDIETQFLSARYLCLYKYGLNRKFIFRTFPKNYDIYYIDLDLVEGLRSFRDIHSILEEWL